VLPRAIHTTADGRRLLVIHGHELDTVVQNIKWLAHLGDIGYTILLRLNTPVNWIAENGASFLVLKCRRKTFREDGC
jgi:UDP-2,3-diacylglucosamine pyrophosphatase LpxH